MKEFTFLLAGMVIGAVLHRQQRRAADAEANARHAQGQAARGHAPEGSRSGRDHRDGGH